MVQKENTASILEAGVENLRPLFSSNKFLELQMLMYHQAYALTQLHDPSTILLCWRINSAGAEHIYDLARPVPENCSNV
jgi:hypothetical protein